MRQLRHQGTRVYLAVAVFTIGLNGCGGGVSSSSPVPNSPSDPSGIASLVLSWSSSSQSSTTTPVIGLGAPGTATVVPSGAPPYQASIAGSCATVNPATSSTSFTVTVTSGFCTITVQDANARFRALEIEGTPPRGFLDISPTGLTDATGTVQLHLGAMLNLTVNESIAGNSNNAPYNVTIQGACVTASSNSPSNGPASVSITATSVGQCVGVFSDSNGEAIPLNFTVS